MKDIEYIKEDLRKSIGEKLYIHCTNVMNTAFDLALNYKIPTDKAMIAGLLHDSGKLLNENVGNLEHAVLGSEIAANKYGIDDIDVINAILYHTTGRENMTMLEKIIYLADKIEPNRRYDGVDTIRELAYTNIDEAIIKSLENTFEYLKSKNIEIDNQSLVTYDFLKKSMH